MTDLFQPSGESRECARPVEVWIGCTKAGEAVGRRWLEEQSDPTDPCVLDQMVDTCKRAMSSNDVTEFLHAEASKAGAADFEAFLGGYAAAIIHAYPGRLTLSDKHKLNSFTHHWIEARRTS